MTDTPKIIKKISLWICIVLFLLGFGLSAAIRFVRYKDTDVHYHANFALYINGKRDEFKSFTFYEEVQACNNPNANNPKTRVHMHDQNNGLIHVHAEGVTWGYFFANLGYTLGDKVIKTDSGVYVDGQDSNKLSFVLNGQSVADVADKVIKSEDKLLINYGNDTQATLDKRYKTVPNDAHEANTEHDPATCSGGEELTFWKRLQKTAF